MNDYILLIPGGNSQMSPESEDKIKTKVAHSFYSLGFFYLVQVDLGLKTLLC